MISCATLSRRLSGFIINCAARCSAVSAGVFGFMVVLAANAATHNVSARMARGRCMLLGYPDHMRVLRRPLLFALAAIALPLAAGVEEPGPARSVRARGASSAFE